MVTVTVSTENVTVKIIFNLFVSLLFLNTSTESLNKCIVIFKDAFIYACNLCTYTCM